MIRACCLHRSGQPFINRITNISIDLASSSRSGQKFYSAFAGSKLRHEVTSHSLTQSPKQWRLGQLPLQRLSGTFTPRFASTTPNPPRIDEVQSDYVPPPPQTTILEEGEFPQDSFGEMTDFIPPPPPVHEHIGFLKELGLDYGWGPTALVETLLEHVHVYLGTPWWASIGITMIIIRAALLSTYIDAADINARRQVVKPLEEPITARIKAAQAERDKMALREALIERRTLHKSAGIVGWKSLVPFVQLPIGFGVFRLMRGMALLPVPGLENGGLLWISDLTIPDPFWILPVATSWLYYIAFKRGGETGNSGLISKRTRMVFQYVVPVVGGIFMLRWPASMQLTFCITASFGALQATIFANNRFRDLVGIQPLPSAQSQPNPQYQAPSSSPSSPETPTGVVENIKGTVSDIMKAGEQYQSKSKQQAQKGRLTEGEKRHAEAYEERRRREFAQEEAMRRHSAQAKFERKQEQETKNQERKERLRRRAEKKAGRQ